jgi:SPP1 family predicted phage head-tail adaptor
MTLAARLRHRVTIERRVDSVDSETGATVYTWQSVLEDVPAEVLTGPGRELRAAGGRQAEADLRVTLRAGEPIYATDRIVWRGVAYGIVSIEEDRTATREVRLVCKAGLTDGV